MYELALTDGYKQLALVTHSAIYSNLLIVTLGLAIHISVLLVVPAWVRWVRVTFSRKA
jgi:hypothetical protein